MTLESPLVSKVSVVPPARLSARTEQSCLTHLRRRTSHRTRPAALHVSSWEWLVFATSMLICCVYAVEMTWTHVDDVRLASLTAR